MGARIFVKPSEAWAFFEKNKERLAKEQVEVAVNADTSIAVCITEENGLPMVTVYRSDAKIDSEPAVKSDCEETVKRLYMKYLFPVVVNTRAKESEDDGDENREYVIGHDGSCLIPRGRTGPEELEDEISQRDEELGGAVICMLESFISDYEMTQLFYEGDDRYVLDLVDNICEFLAESYGISVYRPKWVELESDSDTLAYTEYPYDKIIDGEEDLDTPPGEKSF